MAERSTRPWVVPSLACQERQRNGKRSESPGERACKHKQVEEEMNLSQTWQDVAELKRQEPRKQQCWGLNPSLFPHWVHYKPQTTDKFSRRKEGLELWVARWYNTC